MLTSEIAWCGWRIRVPLEWRPLKIQGEFRKGSMMIGDGEQPRLLVQWRRVKDDGFDVQRWFRERFSRQRAMPEPGAPCPPGFDASAWARDFEVREGEAKSMWYGYSRTAGLLLECVTANLTSAVARNPVLGEVLPALSVSGRDEPIRWSLYDVVFVSPPGFELVRRHLYSGDIALGLAGGDQEELLLRQVYPAGMALSRRSLQGWLETSPFTERRQAPAAMPEKWERKGPGGIVRSGWRRLRFPLGWCNPRYSTAVAAVDGTLDRLLIAEYRTRREHDQATVRWCVENMNC